MASEVGYKKCRSVEYKSNVDLIGGHILIINLIIY